MRAALIGAVLLAQISGTVIKRGTNDIQPLANARVELLDGPTHQIVRTDGAGRFLFDGVQAGRYRVKVTRDGFVRQEYGQRFPNGPSFPVEVTSSKPAEDLIFLMQPAPTITGWVRDEYGGVVPGVLVEAYRKGYDGQGHRTITPVASTLTDDRGQYRLYWLDPGDYVVRGGSAPGGGIYAPTYYPGFADAASAETISIKDREVDGVDFKAIRGGAALIEGSVVLRQGGFAGASITIQPTGDVAGLMRYNAEASQQAGRGQGVFTVPNVPPGTYVASASRTIAGKAYSGHVTFTIPNGRSSYPLRVVMAQDMDVRGVITAQDGITDFSSVRISLDSVETLLPSPSPAIVSRDGSFVVSSVPDGKYLISLRGLPEDAYINEAPDSIEVDSATSPAPLKFVLASPGGVVTGSVRDVGGQPRFGAQVVLLPERLASAGRYRVVTSAPDGGFDIHGVAPGDYKVFAWEAIEPNAYLDPEFIKVYEPRAVHIHVAAGRRISVDLSVIPAD